MAAQILLGYAKQILIHREMQRSVFWLRLTEQV